MSCIIYVTDYELLLIKSSLLSLSSFLFIALCSFNKIHIIDNILFYSIAIIHKIVKNIWRILTSYFSFPGQS